MAKLSLEDLEKLVEKGTDWKKIPGFSALNPLEPDDFTCRIIDPKRIITFRIECNTNWISDIPPVSCGYLYDIEVYASTDDSNLCIANYKLKPRILFRNSKEYKSAERLFDKCNKLYMIELEKIRGERKKIQKKIVSEVKNLID